MKIYAPVKDYSGVSAGVRFVNGIGETDDERIIDWFDSRGYKVGEPFGNLDDPEGEESAGTETAGKELELLDNMTVEQLKEFAVSKGIDIGNATSQNGILVKIKGALADDPDREAIVIEH